jgi:hypothetical protein
VKTLIFDSSSLITMTMNNLLWVLDDLKPVFDGNLCICPAIKAELVDNPLNTKRFEFDALQVMQKIRKGTLTVVEQQSSKDLGNRLLDLANHAFKSKNTWITIVHRGEMEALATGITLNSSAFVVDERTTRLLIESPVALKDLLQSKLHTRVEVNRPNLRQFRYLVRNIKVMRSVELLIVAYEKGLLDKFLLDNVKNPREILIDGLLWGLKLRGCAISREEISDITRLEARD